MAEKGSREGNPRRTSFRKTAVDTALPPHYLDNLEQKRRQLDESIHKYIAAKEREYKTYERDLRQQLKLGQHDGEAARGAADAADCGSNTLLGGGDDPPTATRAVPPGLVDRKAGRDRDQELVGLFTPAYLPALADATVPALERTSSEPPARNVLARSDARVAPEQVRSNSDPTVTAKVKRPSQLQLAHRTSSSGSSADGKLTSALKSPTQPAKQKQKRVSLAVGDAIVAPSDSLPVAMSNNSTPSHSRTRSSTAMLADAYATVASQAHSASYPPPQGVHWSTAEQGTAAETEPNLWTPAMVQTAQPSITTSSSRAANKADPDDDLFEMEDEESDRPRGEQLPDSSFEAENGVVGRINKPILSESPLQQSPAENYDSNGGLVPIYSDEEDHVDFGPGSPTASQQPTSPGFRRPSVSMDPVYTGSDWTRAEHDAVVNDVYGSRPTSKGSFTAGSLGESFMARNSESLTRGRAAQDHPHART